MSTMVGWQAAWIPAFAGMTMGTEGGRTTSVIPANAGIQGCDDRPGLRAYTGRVR